MENDNKRISELRWQKKVLIRQEDRGEITRDEYLEKVKVVEDELRPLINQYVQILVNENIERNKKMEEQNMVEEKVVKEKKVKVPSAEGKVKAVKKPKEDTKASLVAKALQMKSVKTVDKAVEQVKSWKPNADEKQLKTYVNNIIRATKGGKGRWASYTWDEENYLLIPKTQ